MQDIRLDSPLHGRLIPLSEVTDPAFASGAMGRGAAVADPEGRVVSPVDGEVTVLFATKHAIGIHSADGVDLLIHVGVDTVKLEGKHFTSHVAQGDTVQKGQLLLEFDPDAIRAEGYETTTPVLVTNAADYGKITFTLDGAEISSGDDAEEDGAPQEEHSTDAAAEIDPNLPKEERVAKLIWKYVGGAGNVRSAEHCATRLRLIVNDKTLIDEKAIENIDGVKGQFFAAAQYQIILGTGFVDKVYDAFIAGTDLAAAAASGKQEAYKRMTPLQKVSRTLGDVFVPVIPVLVATGLFMGLRGMAQSLGIGMNENLIRMSQILTDTAFAFLPALVCWSTMNRFGGTPVIGIVLGLMLVAPQLPNAYAIAAGDAVPLSMEIFGIPIPVVGYQGSVLPALVLGIFAARLQKWFRTFVPDIVDLIVTPFLTLLVSMLLGLLVIGPIMHTLEIVIFGAVRTFLELPYGIGGFVVGGLHQVIVVFGVHHVFNALEVQLLASTGVDPFNAIITGAIVAQGGAAVAVAARTHNAKKRALYISSAVPAFLGITEPAIFGINLRFMRPFICGLAGGACAGAAAGFLHLAGTGMGITVLPGMLLYLDHLPAYIFVNIVGFAVAFGLTFVTFRPEE